jgi:hypothetical protein
MGLPTFTLVVDHQALVAILNNYTLDPVENPKIQRLKERLSPYVFHTVWRKSREHTIPDALSWAPVNDPAPDDEAVTTFTSRHFRITPSSAELRTSHAEKSWMGAPAKRKMNKLIDKTRKLIGSRGR